MSNRVQPVLRFAVDHDAPSPAVTSAATGIDRVAHRPSESEHREITIFDAPDERLLRAGVVVAHRMLAGRGEWYLAAPSWVPRLPAERVEPVGRSGEMPEEFTRLIGPILRRAPIGSVAALEFRRRDYVLRSADKVDLGVIIDEKTTVRRDGSEDELHREVTVVPSVDMTASQWSSVIESMQAVGGRQVEQHPSLQQRLGAPATGRSDFPAAQTLRPNATMEELVSAVFAADLWNLTALLLDAGSDPEPHVGPLNAQLESVQRDLRGLAHVLAPSWREKVAHLMSDWPYDLRSDAANVALDVTDALVHAVRAPKLGDVSTAEAAPLMLERARAAIVIMVERCQALTVESSDREWAAALGAADILSVSAAVAEPVLDKYLRRGAKRVRTITKHLNMCLGEWDVEEVDLEGVSVEEAYLLGRQAERVRGVAAAERVRFVALWPARIEELSRLRRKGLWSS